MTDVRLDDAVKLKVLPRRDPEAIVSVLGRKIIARYILRRRKHTARKLRPDHHHVVLRDLPLIPVILLIDAVELEKFVILFREMIGSGIGQRLRDRSRQYRIIGLQPLILS